MGKEQNKKILKYCPICEQTINENNKDKIELECKHVYCTPCIKTWFESRKSCPLCRKESKLFPEIKAKGVQYEFEDFESNDNNLEDYDLTDSSSEFGDILMESDEEIPLGRYGRNLPYYLSSQHEEAYIENLFRQGITDEEFKEIIREVNHHVPY